MWHYVPPLRDIRFVVEELLRLPAQWATLPAFAELDRDTSRQVIDEAARFAGEVLAPINASGDLEGCTLLPDGGVRTPAGFREAYRAFVAAGWPTLACATSIGGQGLPQVLNAVLYEMLCSANHAWTMYPALLHGACECLHGHASAELKARYLHRVVSGDWLSTMCLTESEAGSDLGLVRTRAEPQIDGSYRLHGNKIFISGGEHDLAEGIVHLVLARIAGAPPGTKGLSLFLAPKRLDDGTRNALRCIGVEKKMGIHGSATCAMSFEGATAWIVGDPGRGLAAMFVMMNAARLHVALQGLAHAEIAHQNALRYAHERLQMRAVTRPHGATAGPADPIALHAPMRRTLLRQRVLVEGARVVAYEAAHWLDLAEHATAEDQRARAHGLASLLTPVAKAFLSENGFAVASDALQVFGGNGYLHDWGIEQCLRDSRIALIYEGTNEIQAIDLLLRKVLPDRGARFGELLDALQAALPEGARHAGATLGAIGSLRAALGPLLEACDADPELPHRVAADFLRATGLVLLAQAWARADAVAQRALDADPGFYRAKCDSARHCFDEVLPELALRLRLLVPRAPLPFVDLPAA
jgi:alkylation response protein AidB-like acyl-CoA dehydrogenase